MILTGLLGHHVRCSLSLYEACFLNVVYLQKSICSLLQIIDDAAGFMVEDRTVQRHHVGKSTRISSSDSSNFFAPDKTISKLQTKILDKKPSNASKTRKSTEREHQSGFIAPDPSQNARAAPLAPTSDSESGTHALNPEGLEVAALEQPPTLSRSVYSAEENAVIWNAYIQNGCHILTLEACTAISHTINRTSLSSIQNQMKCLAATDQDVEMNRVKKGLFSERNDRRIWRTHLANQQRAPKDQLATEALCAALTKYIPQSVLRIQYRLQFLQAEHHAVEKASKWTSKAMEVVARRRKRKRSGAALTYTAEEDQLVLEAYLSSSQPAERSAAMNSVAKGLNRTAGSVRGRVRRLLPDQPTPYHTAEVAPKSIDAKRKALVEGSSTSANDTSDQSDSPNSNNSKDSGDEVKNVGLLYTAADDDVIWEAYKSTFDQTPRLQALKQAAVQLKRSLGGIISRVKYLKKNSPVEPPANASISAHKQHNHRTTDDKLTATFNPTVSTQSANDNGHAKSRSGCEYTEEEDMAIWEAYFGTTEGPERKEALRAVAAQIGRKYGGMRTHLQSMLDQQTREPDDVSDNSDLASYENSSKGPSCASTSAATAVEHASGAEHSSTVLTRSGANAKDLAHTSTLHIALERSFTTTTATDTSSPLHVAPLPIPLLTSVLQVPTIPTIPPFPPAPTLQNTSPACNNSQDQDDDEDLISADASNDDPRLVKFLKKLKRNDMTVLLPLEVHDQVFVFILKFLARKKLIFAFIFFFYS